MTFRIVLLVGSGIGSGVARTATTDLSAPVEAPSMETDVPLDSETDVHFRETQTFSQPWLWAVLGIGALVTLADFARGNRSTRKTARNLLALGAVALPLRTASLTTEVRDDEISAGEASGGSSQAERSGGVYVKFAPLHRSFRRIPFSDVADVQATGYSPLRYAGWGIRWSPSGIAYTVSGKSGVRFERSDGTSVFVGSDSPDDLIAAVQEASERTI